MIDRRVLLGALVVALAAGAYVLPKGRLGSPASSNTEKRVVIFNLGPYPLMESVRDGVKLGLEQQSGPKVRVDILDAGFQPEAVRTLADRISTESPSVVVAITTPVAQAVLGKVENKIPVVFTFVSAPAAVGYKGPGSLPNATGITDTVPVEQTLSALAQVFPTAKTIGYVVNDSEASAAESFKRFEAALRTLSGYRIVKIPVSSAAEVRQIVERQLPTVDVLMVGPDTMVTGAMDALAGLTSAVGKAVVCTDPISVQRGCAMAIAPDYSRLGRDTAEIVTRILSGEKAGSIPVKDFQIYTAYLNPQSIKAGGSSFSGRELIKLQVQQVETKRQ